MRVASQNFLGIFQCRVSRGSSSLIFLQVWYNNDTTAQLEDVLVLVVAGVKCRARETKKTSGFVLLDNALKNWSMPAEVFCVCVCDENFY